MAIAWHGVGSSCHHWTTDLAYGTFVTAVQSDTVWASRFERRIPALHYFVSGSLMYLHFPTMPGHLTHGRNSRRRMLNDCFLEVA